jgi:hypothetical protein
LKSSCAARSRRLNAMSLGSFSKKLSKNYSELPKGLNGSSLTRIGNEIV